jgi:transcriptional regulator with XRE-family HTH domain
MLVTLLPMVTLARLAQSLKVNPSMLVTLLGMVMPVRLVQTAKAYSPMLVTLFGIVIPVSVVHALYACLPVPLLKIKAGMLVKPSPERVRLTYLSVDLITSAIFPIIRSFAFMETLIGLSGLLAGWLSRYAFSSSALLRLLPPPLPPLPEQFTIEKANTAIRAVSPNSFILFFIVNSFAFCVRTTKYIQPIQKIGLISHKLKIPLVVFYHFLPDIVKIVTMILSSVIWLYYTLTWQYVMGEKKDRDLRRILSANVKKHREMLGISQEKLAEDAKISVNMVQDIEGCRTWVSETTLMKLTLALKTDTYRLFMTTMVHDKEINRTIQRDLSKILQKMRKNVVFDIDEAIRLLELEGQEAKKR